MLVIKRINGLYINIKKKKKKMYGDCRSTNTYLMSFVKCISVMYKNSKSLHFKRTIKKRQGV